MSSHPPTYLLLRFARHAAHDFGRRYPQEGDIELTSDGVRQEAFTTPRRTMQQDTSGLRNQTKSQEVAAFVQRKKRGTEKGLSNMSNMYNSMPWEGERNRYLNAWQSSATARD